MKAGKFKPLYLVNAALLIYVIDLWRLVAKELPLNTAVTILATLFGFYVGGCLAFMRGKTVKARITTALYHFSCVNGVGMAVMFGLVILSKYSEALEKSVLGRLSADGALSILLASFALVPVCVVVGSSSHLGLKMLKE